MTKEQVSSFQEYGPYVPVRTTRGLETFNGVFLGKRKNIAFVFDGSGLLYIQVAAYEGNDFEAAKSAVLDIFDLFDGSFGGARLGEIRKDGVPGTLDRNLLTTVIEALFGRARGLGAEMAKKNAVITVTMDMTPLRQPAGSRLYGRWVYVGRVDTFYVILLQDRPDLPPRKDRSGLVVESLDK